MDESTVSDIDLVRRFRAIGYGGAISDILERLGIGSRVLSSQFQSLVPNRILAGRAITVRFVSYAASDSRIPSLVAMAPTEHPQFAMMAAVAERPPGSVLCIDGRGHYRASIFGELSSHLVYAHGCRGILVAGAIRDTRRIAELEDFAAFSFGASPDAWAGHVATDVNRPIDLPGRSETGLVAIEPGDFVFGDGDGVQVIPNDHVFEVLRRLEELTERETVQRRAILDGLPIPDVYRRFGTL